MGRPDDGLVFESIEELSAWRNAFLCFGAGASERLIAGPLPVQAIEREYGRLVRLAEGFADAAIRLARERLPHRPAAALKAAG